MENRSKIKACFIIGQLVKHGAERQLYELLCGLDKRQFTAVAISLSKGGYWAGEIRKLGVPLYELERKKNREFTRLFRLIKLLRTIQPNLIYTSAYAGNYYGRLAGILTGARLIIASERSTVDAGISKRRWEILLDKILYFFTTGIICNSRYSSKALVEKLRFKREKVFTVYNGLNFLEYQNKFSDGASFRRDKIRIGTVGRIYAVKNHKLFLDAARFILQKRKREDYEFHIVGDGPMNQEVQEYARKLNIQDSVVFHGEKNNVPEILQTFDVFVITSDYEGLSNAIMEAMLTGLPVVATAVGGNSELVREGQTGFLCPAGDAEAIAGKITELIDRPDLARQFGERGRKKILREFSTPKMVRNTEEIFCRLIRKTYNSSLNLCSANKSFPTEKTKL